MGKTIKEKARIAFERELEITVTYNRKITGAGEERIEKQECRGKISHYDMSIAGGFSLRIYYEGSEGSYRSTKMMYSNVTDIRFVDEPETKEEDEKPEAEEPLRTGQWPYMSASAIQEDIGKMIDSATKPLNEKIDILQDRANMLEAYSSNPLPPDEPDVPENSIDSDGVTEAFKDKLEAAMLSKQPMRVTWQHGNGSGEEEGIIYETMLNDFRFKENICKYDYTYIVSVEPIEPDEPEDIAKQRWEVVELPNGRKRIFLKDKEVGHDLFDPASPCTLDAQIELAAAAPELADRLRNVVDGCTDGHIAPSPGVVAEAVALLHSLGVEHIDEQSETETSANEIVRARHVMREAFENSPEFKLTYIANIAMVISDHFGSELNMEEVNEAAEKILDRVFEK